MEKNKKGEIGTEILSAFVGVASVLILMILLILVFNIFSTTSFDSTRITLTVTNESFNPIAYVNQTGYTLSRVNSSNQNYTITAIYGDWNQSNGSQSGVVNTPTGYNVTLNAANYTVSTGGIVANTTNYNFGNVSISYTYRTNSVVIAGANTANTSTINAVPLIGILFVVIAIGAIIGVLVGSFVMRGKKGA